MPATLYSQESVAVRSSLAFGGVNSMRKENDHVPAPWGDDMEEALMAQGEAIRNNSDRSSRQGITLLWVKPP
jgi:hypothetical protein